jgi:hypothetical protein
MVLRTYGGDALKVIYTRWHNNYGFVIGQEYEATVYKMGWLQIDGQLYRTEHFKVR